MMTIPHWKDSKILLIELACVAYNMNVIDKLMRLLFNFEAFVYIFYFSWSL